MALRTVLASGICGVVLVLGAPVGAQTTSFGIDPAPGSATESGYFSLTADPGTTATQSVRVSNSSDAAVQVRLVPTDATTQSRGGVDYGANEVAPKLDGAWIRLSETTVALPPKTQREIPFTVQVPATARPGVHLAGIAAFVPSATTEQSVSAGNAGAALIIQSRRVLGVKVTLPGPAAPLLSVTGVTTDARPNGLNLLVAIANEGNGLTSGTGHLTVTGPMSLTTDFPLDTFVPATAVQYPLVLGAAPPNGTYHVHISIDYKGGAGPAVFDTSQLTIGKAEQSALQNREVPTASSAKGHNDATNTSPVAFVIGGLAAGALLFWAVPSALRRRRRTDAPEDLPSPRP